MTDSTLAAHWLQAVDGLRDECDRLRQREQWMIGAALTGGEVAIFGRRARLRIEWLDGPPHGMTEDDLRRMGEKMLPGDGSST